MFCTNCGASLPDGTAFCTQCGARVEALPEQPGEPDQATPWETTATAQDPSAAYAYAGSEPAGMASVGSAAQKHADDGTPSKKRAALIAVAVVAVLAVVGIAAWFVLGGAGGTAASGPKKHLVSVTNSVEGLNTETGTKIPLQVTGTDADGNAYDERFYVDDAGFELPEGSYTISVPASPIAADGTIYSTDGASVEATVDENGFDTEGGLDISLEPIAAAEVSDEQIEAAYEAAKDGGAESEEAAETLKDAATSRRDEAVAQQQAAEEAANSKASAIADAQARGLTVYEGTVQVFQTDDDMAAFQGISNPNPGYESGPHTVLVLDGATELTATNGDGQGSRSGTATMISLGSSSGDFSQYEGQSVAVGFANLFWQSDVSLPMNEPRAYNAELVWAG